MRRGGETALHFAAAANNAAVVRKLIAAGSEVEALDRSGCAPLDVALRVGAVTTAAEALVEGGAKLTAERLEAMHSGAYDGGSELRMFPAVDTIELRGKDAEETGVEGERNGGVRCEHCGALTYSRKARICGSCGKALAAMLGVRDDQEELIASERKWAQKVANSFDPKGRTTTSGSAMNETLSSEVAFGKSPASLLRDFSYAEAFRRRKRPMFWVQVSGYVVAMGMLQVIMGLGIIRLPAGVVVALTLVMLVVGWRAWRGGRIRNARSAGRM